MSEKTMSMEECLVCADEVIELIRKEALRLGESELYLRLGARTPWIRDVIAKFFDELPDEED